jgi:hypothetical protein
MIGLPLASLILSVAEPREFLQFDPGDAGRALPAEWRTRAVRGQSAPTSVVVSDTGGAFLRVQGNAQAGWIVRQVSPVLRPAAGRLSWSWRTPMYAQTADLRSEATDDAALRVFVAFGPIRAIGRAPKTIFYSVSGAEDVGYERAGFASRDVYVISAGKPSADWKRIEVDPFADYERIWKMPPPPIAAIGFLQDTEQTKERAMSDIKSLNWIPGRASIP